MHARSAFLACSRSQRFAASGHSRLFQSQRVVLEQDGDPKKSFVSSGGRCANGFLAQRRFGLCSRADGARRVSPRRAGKRGWPRVRMCAGAMKFLEAGKKRFVGDTRYAATSIEVVALRQGGAGLTQFVLGTALENRLLKRSVTASSPDGAAVRLSAAEKREALQRSARPQ